MELKHHFTVPSSLADTWHSFNQLEEIAPCFPGATLTSVEGDTFTGTVKIKLGPIAMLYTGTGEFLSRDEATHTVVIQATGKDKRGNGTAGATVTAVLAAAGDGTTVDVSTDMNVTGKPAQFGRSVIQDISDKLLEQFVQCVIDKAGQPVVEPGETPEPDEAPEFQPDEPPEPDEAAEPSEAAAASSPAASPPASAQTSRHLAPPPESAPELDLGSAVLPVLAKRFGPAIAGAAVVLAIIVCLCRRKRRRS